MNCCRGNHINSWPGYGCFISEDQGTEMLKKEDKKSKDAQRSSISPEPNQQELEVKSRGHSILHIPKTGSDWTKTQCCGGLTYILLAVVVILLASIEIIVSGVGATTERHYTKMQSSRLVSLVVLAVTAAVTIGVTVYGIVGVSKKHTKPLHTASLVLVVLALIQAIIAGISIHITELDELGITRALSESFARAKNGDLTQIHLWDATQSSVECCGLYTPEDYRDPYTPHYFPPDTPFSCCPSYHSPNTTTEKEREMCKANNQFYKVGCREPVLQVIKGASRAVIILTTLLIIAEIIISILAAFLSQKRKQEKHEHIEFTPTAPKSAESPQLA